ncbi:hypothetical protein, partial [Streptomyces sp. NPDC050988]|uniref:hypothetical protein n=1 Tax=Streptomyces sp. NPDC050988 TaxID=3365637 RepID=UPI003792A049
MSFNAHAIMYISMLGLMLVTMRKGGYRLTLATRCVSVGFRTGTGWPFDMGNDTLQCWFEPMVHVTVAYSVALTMPCTNTRRCVSVGFRTGTGWPFDMGNDTLQCWFEPMVHV